MAKIDINLRSVQTSNTKADYRAITPAILRDCMERAKEIAIDEGLIVASDGLIADGKKHYCGTIQKPRSKNGRYILHLDAFPVLWLENYNDGYGGEGKSFNLLHTDEYRRLSPAELADYERLRKEREAQAEAEKLAMWTKAAKQAAEIYGNAKKGDAVGNNQYLSKKHIEHWTGMGEDSAGRLIIPFLAADGAKSIADCKIATVQYIGVDGGKEFLYGGRKKGCFAYIPAEGRQDTETFLLAEGAATARSCSMATGYPVIIAGDCGNLLPVALEIRRMYPEVPLAFIADNDAKDKSGNPLPHNAGFEHAEKAAMAVGGWVCKIPLLDGANKTDANDFLIARGTDALKVLIEDCLRSSPFEETLPDSDDDDADGASIQRYLPDTADVPLDAFPSELQNILLEASEAFNVPLAIPAACLLALSATCIGRTRCVKFKRGWKEHGNLWIAIVARSGAGKTPVMDAFLSSIYKVQAAAWRKYKQENDEYLDAVVWHSAQLKKLKEGDAIPQKPEKPLWRQYYVDDSTLEGLQNSLIQNPRGILWKRDELSGMIQEFDKFSAKQGGTQARLLSCYNCSPWTNNRINEGRNAVIEKPCVSLFGGIQPGKLRDVFTKSDAESGFLPRLLLIRAEKEKPALWTEKVFSYGSEKLLQRIAEHLLAFELAPADDGSPEGQSVEVPVSAKAKAAYTAWFDDIETKAWAAGLDGTQASIIDKAKATAQRIALNLHCMKEALGGNGAGSAISENTMLGAIKITEWAMQSQRDTLAFMEKTSMKLATPVELAVMRAVVNAEAEIIRDGWKITNNRLCELVNARLSVAIATSQIGKVATGLGLVARRLGGKGKQVKTRLVSADILKEFKLAIRQDKKENTPTPKPDEGKWLSADEVEFNV